MNEQQEMKQNSARLIKLILLICGGAVLLGFLVLLGLYLFLPEKDTDERNIYFYPVTDVDIFMSGEYHDSDRVIMYCENSSGYGIKEQINAEEGTSDGKLRFLETYFNCIIAGNNEMYPLLFTEEYRQENTLPTFTQQMLYKMCIYYEQTERAKDGSMLITYRLEYMIRKNNGTFRRDVGSDEILPQYVVLKVSSDERSVLIDDVFMIKTVNK